MKFRIVLLFLLLVADCLALPLLLEFPWYIKNGGLNVGLAAWREWVASNPMAGPAVLLSEERTRTVWLYFQPIAGAGVLGIFTSYGFGRRKRKKEGIGGPEAAGQGQFGTARWQTQKEMRQNFYFWNTSQKPRQGGIVLGAQKFRGSFCAWLDTGDTHNLLIGATRSGKSRRVIIPSIRAIARAGESMIIPDPKKELYNMNAGLLKREGYNVVLLDFQNPFAGNQWNPLHPVTACFRKGDLPGASKAARQVAHMMVYQFQRPEDYAGDKIWPRSEKSLITALNLAVGMEAPEPARHMGSVYRTLSTLGSDGGSDLNRFFNSLDNDHPARVAYGVAAMTESKLRNGIFSGAASQLELWSDPGVCWLTARQDHDLAGPGREKTAVFIVLPDEDTSLHVLAALYIAQTYQALSELARENGGRLERRVHFLLEEFGNLPPIPDFAEKVTMAGGRGIKFLIAVQGLDQIKRRYRDDAGTISGNCNTWIYLSTADYETARLLSEKTGKYTQQTESLSAQVRKVEHSRGVTYGLAGRSLLLPDEILRWPVGRSLVFPSRQNPANLPLPDLSQWPGVNETEPFENMQFHNSASPLEFWIPRVDDPVFEKEEVPAATERVEPVDILSEL